MWFPFVMGIVLGVPIGMALLVVPSLVIDLLRSKSPPTIPYSEVPESQRFQPKPGEFVWDVKMPQHTYRLIVPPWTPPNA